MAERSRPCAATRPLRLLGTIAFALLVAGPVAAFDEVDDQIARFNEAYRKAKEDREKAELVAQLAETVDPRTFKIVREKLEREKSLTIRSAAALAVGRFTSEAEAPTCLSDVLQRSSNTIDLQEACLRGLASLGTSARPVLDRIHSFFSAVEIRVARAAVAAAVGARDLRTVPELIHEMRVVRLGFRAWAAVAKPEG